MEPKLGSLICMYTIMGGIKPTQYHTCALVKRGKTQKKKKEKLLSFSGIGVQYKTIQYILLYIMLVILSAYETLIKS